MSDRVLGDWIKQRGVRDQTIIIAKGAHTPFCDPRNMRTQIHQSLEWLQTDYADVYMLHRDNPDIPVGEFVDVLNEEVKAGRIGIFGGSNWSLERIDEANDYAKKKGLQGFGAVSNQFSLARMVNPPWGGCISASDEASKKWFASTGIPLFAWGGVEPGARILCPRRARFPCRRGTGALLVQRRQFRAAETRAGTGAGKENRADPHRGGLRPATAILDLRAHRAPPALGVIEFAAHL